MPHAPSCLSVGFAGRFNALLREAAAMRASTPEAAFGRCLALSLELARATATRQIEVDLVVWHVRDDSSFCDHWAVGIGETQVIDLTRAQIDGRRGVLFDLQDYPADFTAPRRYPARLLLADYATEAASGRARLSSRFVWTLQWRLFRHDLARGERLRPMASLARFAFLQAWHGASARLISRHARLVSRLGEPARS